MAVEVFWDNPQKTIVRYVFTGKWTWDEFYPAYYAAIAMEKSQPHRVHVIVDLQKGSSVPSNVLLHIKNITDKQPDNIGLTIVVSTSKFIASLYDIGVKFYPRIGYYFRVVTMMDAAYSMIAAEQGGAASL
ncbi:MAG: hypothetical protein HXY40_17570 [Chloroflexi bacterium]|nr:hypothetical protein [Chloroflexota bacterium]